ncbi:MAG TPA: hypothetical protein VLI05_02605 [Candidatus Saccharimonadia bacterium]|nr:hypothetical protein [Candidatus Saccharimonadia bacterium]
MTKPTPTPNRPQFNYTQLGLVAAGIIVLLGLGLYLWPHLRPAQIGATPTPGLQSPDTTRTIDGTIVCLPHKDTTGPQTEECAIGLQDDQGQDYGLINAPAVATVNGSHVRVTGTFEAAPSDTKYNITKTIKVVSLTKL